jgi:phage/plasmid-like protein (TIGR03299 family)
MMNATNRNDPLLSVGFDIPKKGSAVEVLQEAHLAWQVSEVHLLTAEGRPVRTHKGLVRSDTGDLLSVVGRNYRPIQNLAMFSMLTSLVDDGDAVFTHAGQTHGGRRVFAVMDLPGLWKLERDPHATQMLATTTHDGTGALRITPLATRLACRNQINGLFWRGRKGGVSIPHKAAANRRVDALRSALGLTVVAMAEYELATRGLLDIAVGAGDVDRFLAELFPQPDRDSPRFEGSQERVQAAQGAVRAAYNGGQGAQIAGTAFGLFQAAVDFSDWGSPVRAADAGVRRMEKMISGSDFAFKNRAYALAAAVR